MQKAIIIGAFAIAFAAIASFAAGGAKMKVTSSAFQEGGNIPLKFTCDGADVNPALRFEGAPAETKSLVLIVDDPKASEIAENSAPGGAVQGTNDFPKKGYGGPCPPSGTHRYYFKIFALDQTLGLKPGAKHAEVDAAMRGHVVAHGELMGRYSRKK